MIIDIDDSSFEQEVLNNNLPVLVDFWASWCGPCKMLLPILKELSEEFKGRVVFAKMDIESSPDAPSKFNVRSIPTMIFFYKGESFSTKIGLYTKEKIIDWIKQTLSEIS